MPAIDEHSSVFLSVEDIEENINGYDLTDNSNDLRNDGENEKFITMDDNDINRCARHVMVEYDNGDEKITISFNDFNDKNNNFNAAVQEDTGGSLYVEFGAWCT